MPRPGALYKATPRGDLCAAKCRQAECSFLLDRESVTDRQQAVPPEMDQGRGTASSGGGGVLLAAVLLVGFLVAMSAQASVAEAATYMVGDYGGWKFNVAGWAKGRTFRAGDHLVFSYNRAVHDVAVVNAAAYRSCVVPRGAKVLRSGRDRMKLGRGTHYFVCTVRGHCQAGMKLAVRTV